MTLITIVAPYIDVTSADVYMATRWPHTAWDDSSSSDKTAALYTASEAIDRLKFAGVMASKQLRLLATGIQPLGTTSLVVSGTGVVPNASLFQLDGYTYAVVSHTETAGNTTGIVIASPGLQVATADGDPLTIYQTRQFPRGTDSVVPQGILKATCELAYAFLDGADPSIEAENVNTTGQSLGDVRTTYERSFAQPHILAGIPSLQAWHCLLPFFRDPNEIRMLRDSYKLGPSQSFQ